MPTLSWYLRRAQAMSVVEVLHRTKLEVRKRSWRKRISTGAREVPPVADWSRFPIKDFHPSFPLASPQSQLLLEEAESYLRHEWSFFNLNGIQEREIDWSLDPASRRSADLKFSFDIDHRDEKRVGNIKTTWEKNRHHHLTVMATAYSLTREERFAEEVASQILDWTTRNPFLIGVNWTHPLEQGIRLIAWVWCERLLRGSPHHQKVFGPESPVWTTIYQHQVFIEATYSRGSSANNHLIGEMAGLFIASTAWPIFEPTSRWQALSRRFLEREVGRQTFASGINRELAFSYHIFTLEFFLLSLLEAQSCDRPFSTGFQEYLRRKIEVIPLLTDVGGNLPRYGDGDEGMAIQLQGRTERRDTWLLEVGSHLLGANVPLRQPHSLGASMLGCKASPSPYKNPSQQSFALKDAGIYILHRDRFTKREIFVFADAGPHGFLSIAAHAHADALSFTLSVGGLPILVDPGTYAYHTDKRWRTYFRGTSAHNTLAINNLDQSTQAGAFLWTSKAATSVHRWEVHPTGGTLIASHDGYKKSLGVIHERKLSLEDKTLHLEDTLHGEGEHDLRLCFHCAPECHITRLGSSEAEITREGVRVNIILDNALSAELVRGGRTAGWYSPEFARKEKSFSLMGTGRKRLPLTLRTTIHIKPQS